MLTRDRSEMGSPVSGRVVDAGPVITSLSSPSRLPSRTERQIIALRLTQRWGAAPDRVSSASGPINGRAGPGPVPNAVTAQHRPGHRIGGAPAGTGPIRKNPSWQAGPRRHQEAMPDPGRWRVAGPWPQISAGLRRWRESGPRSSAGCAVVAGSGSCTTRSMATPGWRIQRSTTTSSATPRSGSGTERRCSSQPPASRSTRW